MRFSLSSSHALLEISVICKLAMKWYLMRMCTRSLKQETKMANKSCRILDTAINHFNDCQKKTLANTRVVKLKLPVGRNKMARNNPPQKTP